MDVFDWIDWQRTPAASSGTVVALRPRGAAIAMVNRRVAAVRGFFGFLVMAGQRPAPGVCWGIWVRAGHAAGAGCCVNRTGCRSRCRWPRSARS